MKTELYTIDTLTEANQNNQNVLPITQKDVDKVNAFVISLNNQLALMEPKDSDCILLHGKNNSGLITYNGGHIQRCLHFGDKEKQLYVCTQPYTPYISLADTEGHYTNASGGYWMLINKSKVTFTGDYAKKDFWNFIKGSGASMGVYFSAWVKVFEYTDIENIY